VECVHAENLKRAANKGNDFCELAKMKLSREGREVGEEILIHRVTSS
jgi:hypothetical protein